MDIIVNKVFDTLKIDSPYLNNERKSKLNDMKKHQFKPSDKVLVRDSNSGLWRVNFYSHRDYIGNHVCISGVWTYCIPYNEQTAHLIGTNKPYEEPEPKTFIVSWPTSNGQHRVEYTDKEFENFIKTAVLHSKDIQNFTVCKTC